MAETEEERLAREQQEGVKPAPEVDPTKAAKSQDHLDKIQKSIDEAEKRGDTSTANARRDQLTRAQGKAPGVKSSEPASEPSPKSSAA